jgi:HD-like signal output (HDOD) protein
MINVLFVDDEPAVLEDLESRLQRARSKWDMKFVTTAAEALDLMSRIPVDVVVSDLQMPVMDGIRFLGIVRERYPRAARFMLTDKTSEDEALRTMPLAHQVLTKPCNTAALEKSISRICALQSRKQHPGVAKALGLLNSLPALPQLYWDLVRAIDNPKSSTIDIAAIIERDVGMTARILQLANSALFGGGQPIKSIKDAVIRIGLVPIRSVVLSLQLFRGMGESYAPAGFSLEKLQAESWETARLASEMVRNPETRKTAFAAGVLHDIGHLILACSMPSVYSRICKEAGGRDRVTHATEELVFGCDHAEIGAQMLSLWGLPSSLVEAVAHHHLPSRSDEEGFGAIGAVHVASAMIAERMTEDPAFGDFGLDFEYLEKAGMTETVAGWRLGKPIVAV